MIETSWEFRKLEANWTKTTTLKQHQKIWLDTAYQQQREEDEAWLNELISEFARWFINAYKKNTGKEDINTEMLTIKTLIEKQKEGLL